jgi:glutamate racemase
MVLIKDKISAPGPIGVFDSGFGGLTILKEIVETLPQYDYIYLGDNARAPYGSRSFETVYEYTLQCVKKLFELNCELIILACNTASAKALRTIQQKDLPLINSHKRVLGVIRPTTEIIGNLSQSKSIGIMGTTGTVQSGSYLVEIEKFFPELRVHQQACPQLVPLIENNEYENEGADFFIKKYVDELLKQDEKIDSILLACTHYPLIENKIKSFLPAQIKLISQGKIVAGSLKQYLINHPQMEAKCSKQGTKVFYTTDDVSNFITQSTKFFLQEKMDVQKLNL